MKYCLRLFSVILGLLPFWAGSLSAAEGDEVLQVVYLQNDSVCKAYFAFDTHPEVVFDDETIYVTSDAQNATYVIEHVQELSFVGSDVLPKGDDPEDPGEIIPSHIVFQMMQNDVIRVCGQQLTPEVFVYAADGKSVTVPVRYSENEMTIQLGSLSRGLYIIKTNRQSFKFVKK